MVSAGLALSDDFNGFYKQLESGNEVSRGVDPVIVEMIAEKVRDYREDMVLIADLLRVIAMMMILFSHLSITIGPSWSERVQPYFG